MTKQKTISSLSIAAIALAAAAVPALAQGQTESADPNASMNGATSVVEHTIASNLESSAVRKSRVVTPNLEFAAGDVVRSTKPMVLSAVKGQNNLTSAPSSVNYVDFKDAAVDPIAKKQFRVDETQSDNTRHMAFVPSRGQKLPE